MHLAQDAGQRVQRCTLGGIAGVGFNRFFDLLQTFQNFARGGDAQLFVIRLLHNIGAQSRRCTGGYFAFDGSGEPAFHDRNLFFEIRRQIVEMVNNIFGHQQGRSHFQRHHLGVKRIRIG